MAPQDQDGEVSSSSSRSEVGLEKAAVSVTSWENDNSEPKRCLEVGGDATLERLKHI